MKNFSCFFFTPSIQVERSPIAFISRILPLFDLSNVVALHETNYPSTLSLNKYAGLQFRFPFMQLSFQNFFGSLS